MLTNAIHARQDAEYKIGPAILPPLLVGDWGPMTDERHVLARHYADLNEARWRAATDIPDLTKRDLVAEILARDPAPELCKSAGTLMKWSKARLWAHVKHRRSRTTAQ